MWEKFKQRLGRFVQGVLNIFRKKKPQRETITVNTKGFTDENGITFGPGTITLTPTEKYGKQPITIYWEDDNTTEIAQAELDAYDEQLYQELLKMLNTHKTFLPKRIEVPTLIVSTYANWEYDSVGVDISLLEEQGIAHFFCTSTKTMQELRELYPEADEWEEEDECASAMVKDAVLLEWGDGTWSWL